MGRRRIANPALRRQRVAPGHTLQQQALGCNVIGIARGGEEKLLQHILLGVAAAELRHRTQRRAHQRHSLPGRTLRMAQNGRANYEN